MAPPNAQEIKYQLAHIHEDRSNDIVVSHAICIVIAVVAVVLRFSSRRLCKAPILADDFMSIVALVRFSFNIYTRRQRSRCYNQVTDRWKFRRLDSCSCTSRRRSNVYALLF